jgi:acid phosphatase
MENHSFDRVVGDPCCPYVSALAGRGVLFTRWYGVAYPSLPNYLAMTGGSTFGRTTDATSPLVPGDNLFDQMTAGHIRWGVYEESMPSACFRGSTVSARGGSYVLKHDPAMMFADVSAGPQCRNVVPFGSLDVSSLPAFAFVTPNLCHDMHDCPAATGDAWLAGHVPGMLRWGATVLITWDTGDPDRTNGGGHVATVLVGPGIAPARVDTVANHYSLLASIERAYGLPALRRAATVPAFDL